MSNLTYIASQSMTQIEHRNAESFSSGNQVVGPGAAKGLISRVTPQTLLWVIDPTTN